MEIIETVKTFDNIDDVYGAPVINKSKYIRIYEISADFRIIIYYTFHRKLTEDNKMPLNKWK